MAIVVFVLVVMLPCKRFIGEVSGAAGLVYTTVVEVFVVCAE